MPSELEGLIFPHFFAENRIVGCLGAILEASWAVLAKFLGRLGPQLGSNLGSGAAQEPPERSLQITHEASWSQEPPKSRPEPSKTPLGRCPDLSKPRFWSILGRI